MQADLTQNGSTAFFVKYPSCGGMATALRMAPVRAGFGTSEELGSAIRVSFGTAMWISLVIHIVAVEYYVTVPHPTTSQVALT